MRTRITEQDYLTAMRKASRELEIELHGKQVSMRKARTHKSKKVYDRRAYKAITIND
jgi:hypothetical protein